jgi:hypothetical protein
VNKVHKWLAEQKVELGCHEGTTVKNSSLLSLIEERDLAELRLILVDQAVASIICCLGVDWKEFPDAKLDADRTIAAYQRAKEWVNNSI